MKFPKFAVLAFALLAGSATSGAAAPIDYVLDIALADASPSMDMPAPTLRGTLSYDGDDAMTGRGTFTIGSVTDSFEGFSFLMDLGSGSTGVLFDGFSTAGTELYINIATGLNDAISGTVHYCAVSGCSFFDSLKASALPATISVPGDTGSLPNIGLSPVPLPPSVAVFGGALLALAGVASQRRKLQPLRVKR